MRKIISILLLSLMLLQAIPVLHFFGFRQTTFFVALEEEKPQDPSEEKKEGKEFLFTAPVLSAGSALRTFFAHPGDSHYASPFPDFQTPPPDRC